MISGTRFSAIVITFNEERNIRDCLESVRWADEIVVVDSFSRDRTVEIAAQYTDKVVQRAWPGYVEQTQYALEQATCEWVIWLDADERLTPEAYAQIRKTFEQSGGPRCDGFAFPRRTYFMGRWIRHSGWYPQYRTRLFRRAVSRIGGEPPHPKAIVKGRVEKLKGDILHYSYPGGVIQLMEKSAIFARDAAQARHARGQRFSLTRCVLGPPLHFARRYLLNLGLLDGVPGLAICASAAYYRFVREVKLWEIERMRRVAAPPQADLQK